MTSGAGAGLWKRAEIARARLPSKENLICSLLARADFVSYRSLIRLNAIQDWRKQPNARFKFRLARSLEFRVDGAYPDRTAFCCRFRRQPTASELYSK
jgi:hypothetical protein